MKEYKEKEKHFLSVDLPLGQQWLIDCMNRLNYRISEPGVCCGIAYIGMQAMLAKSIPSLNEQLFLISTTSLDEIEQIHQSLTIQLLDFEIKWANIFKVLKTIWHYQKKESYEYGLYPQKSLDKKGGIEQIDSFSGFYDKHELKVYFEALENELQSCKHIFVLILKNSSHVISIGYQPASKKWLHLEPNILPAIELNTEQLLRALKRKIKIRFSYDPQTKECHILNEEELKSYDPKKIYTYTIPAFFKKGYTGFNSEIYSVKKHSQSIRGFVNKWQKNQAWLDIHNAYLQKASLIDDSGSSWLHFAASNDPKAVSAYSFQKTLLKLLTSFPDILSPSFILDKLFYQCASYMSCMVLQVFV